MKNTESNLLLKLVEEKTVIFALFLIAGLDKNKEAENDNTNDHSTACNTKEILPPKENKIAATITKKKQKTNMEKSLDVVFQKFQDASSSDFSR